MATMNLFMHFDDTAQR